MTIIVIEAEHGIYHLDLSIVAMLVATRTAASSKEENRSIVWSGIYAASIENAEGCIDFLVQELAFEDVQKYLHCDSGSCTPMSEALWRQRERFTLSFTDECKP